QTRLAPATILTEAGKAAFTIIEMIFEVAGLPEEQEREEVITTFT
ncbi:MAG: hypothetical protein FD155_2860, partial [Bacteroidetes bacterium]